MLMEQGSCRLDQSSAQAQHLRESVLGWMCNTDFCKSHPSPGVLLLVWAMVTLQVSHTFVTVTKVLLSNSSVWRWSDQPRGAGASPTSLPLPES